MGGFAPRTRRHTYRPSRPPSGGARVFARAIAKERASFNEGARKQALSEVMSRITDEAPACFLWTINMLWGMAKSIDYTPRPDLRIFASDIRVR